MYLCACCLIFFAPFAVKFFFRAKTVKSLGFLSKRLIRVGFSLAAKLLSERDVKV
jgi:hypothetical protein